MSFTRETASLFDACCDTLFASLRAGEDLNVNLVAEESLFVRFNGNRVRQNTDVRQRAFTLQLQSAGRTVSKARTAGGDPARDRAALLALLDECRREAAALPVDPHQVPLANNGESEEEFPGSLPSAKELLAAVAAAAEGSDLAGLYAGGPVIRANRNSKGQRHWFATDTFFFDYSLYAGPKAAKGVYAGSRWEPKELAANVARTRSQLALLQRPERAVSPGRYRTWFAPKAFGELLGMMGWLALSGSAWKQGRSPFRKLADGERKLSPLFSVRENFGLGLSCRFNELGEVSPSSVSLIEKGELKNLLVSSRTAKEFGLKGNAASEGEAPRTLDIQPGTLEDSRVLRELGTGLYLSNLHYLNWSDPVTARVTGMTRYACFWVEGGEIAAPIRDLRWDESLYDALGTKLVALGAKAELDPSTETYFQRSLGGLSAPGALVDDFTFTL